MCIRDREYTRLIHRLNRIEGQIRGIRGMVENDAYCPDILVQSAAAGAALMLAALCAVLGYLVAQPLYCAAIALAAAAFVLLIAAANGRQMCIRDRARMR